MVKVMKMSEPHTTRPMQTITISHGAAADRCAVCPAAVLLGRGGVLGWPASSSLLSCRVQRGLSRRLWQCCGGVVVCAGSALRGSRVTALLSSYHLRRPVA